MDPKRARASSTRPTSPSAVHQRAGGFAILRVQSQRFTIMFQGRAGPILGCQHHAQVGVGVGEAGGERQGLPEHGLRLGEPPQQAIGGAQVAVIGRLGGVEPDPPGNVLDGSSRVASLQGDDSQVLPRSRMVRRHGEDLPVDRLGGVQPALLMERDGLLVRFGDGGHRLASS